MPTTKTPAQQRPAVSHAQYAMSLPKGGTTKQRQLLVVRPIHDHQDPSRQASLRTYPSTRRHPAPYSSGMVTVIDRATGQYLNAGYNPVLGRQANGATQSKEVLRALNDSLNAPTAVDYYGQDDHDQTKGVRIAPIVADIDLGGGRGNDTAHIINAVPEGGFPAGDPIKSWDECYEAFSRAQTYQRINEDASDMHGLAVQLGMNAQEAASLTDQMRASQCVLKNTPYINPPEGDEAVAGILNGSRPPIDVGRTFTMLRDQLKERNAQQEQINAQRTTLAPPGRQAAAQQAAPAQPAAQPVQRTVLAPSAGTPQPAPQPAVRTSFQAPAATPAPAPAPAQPARTFQAPTVRQPAQAQPARTFQAPTVRQPAQTFQAPTVPPVVTPAPAQAAPAPVASVPAAAPQVPDPQPAQGRFTAADALSRDAAAIKSASAEEPELGLD